MKSRLLALAVGVAATASPALAGGHHPYGSQHFVGFTFGTTRTAPAPVATPAYAGPVLHAGPALYSGPVIHSGPAVFAPPPVLHTGPTLYSGPALYSGPVIHHGTVLHAGPALYAGPSTCTNLAGTGNAELTAQITSINQQIATINARLNASGTPIVPPPIQPGGDGVVWPHAGPRLQAGAGLPGPLLGSIENATRNLNDAIELYKKEPTAARKAQVELLIGELKQAKAMITAAEAALPAKLQGTGITP